MKAIEKAQKNQKKKSKSISITDVVEISNALSVELDSNPEYSLQVDPTNKYNLSDEEKVFIKHYIDFKSIPLAADLTNIDLDTAKGYFASYPAKQEIRRINRAMYQRQFHNKLLSLDDISGWLSSLLTDDNVPLADRLKTTDKLRVAQMIIDLNKYKLEALEKPELIVTSDVEKDIKELSVSDIKQLLNKKNADKLLEQKQSIINQINEDGRLSPEEEAFLKTLSIEELEELLNKRE